MYIRKLILFIKRQKKKKSAQKVLSKDLSLGLLAKFNYL